ncbi:hypothetical protein [Salinarimonas soli]|uniref:Uncharacterized protein n=1 Tax=Salinarimonas soli TaxID=1638099 RepID=A0A5B2V4E5_9HYPH|nr:hypothetical protein [Salinarimonas soli]KAA2234383.1 hypothetical protein F0L46_24035 [Salinarimonas soli]
MSIVRQVGEIQSRRRTILLALLLPPAMTISIVVTRAMIGEPLTADEALWRLGLSLVVSAILVPLALWSRTLEIAFGALAYRALGGKVRGDDSDDRGPG